MSDTLVHHSDVSTLPHGGVLRLWLGEVRTLRISIVDSSTNEATDDDLAGASAYLHVYDELGNLVLDSECQVDETTKVLTATLHGDDLSVAGHYQALIHVELADGREYDIPKGSPFRIQVQDL